MVDGPTAENSDKDSEEDLKCNYCNKIVRDAVECSKCTKQFHPACMRQSANAKNTKCAHTQSEVRTNTNIEVISPLENENRLLKRIILELEEKNSALQETIAVLKEHVVIINKFYTQTERNKNLDDQLELQQINEAPTTPIATIETIKNQRTTKTYAKTLEDTQRQKMTKVINLTEDIGTGQKEVYKPKPQPRRTMQNALTNNEFTTVTYKRNARKSNKMIGTFKNEGEQEIGFQGPEKKVWIYLYRVKSTASEDNIRKFMQSKPGYTDTSTTVKELPSNSTHLGSY